jgi:hypothetical protein
MNASPDSDRLIVHVLDSLKRARRLLLDPSPQNLDCCQALVSQCVEQIAGLSKDRGVKVHATQRLTSQVRQIQQELNSIARLLDSAAAFRRDLLRVISKATQGATAPEQTGIAQIDTEEEKARRLHVPG